MGQGDQAQTTYKATGSAYYPDSSAMEGGFKDTREKPLRTLQQYLRGTASYVSVAMDKKAFAYGTRLHIPEIAQRYNGGKPIEFRVVDTGGAFKGKGTTRIDICVATRKDTYESTLDGALTLVVVP